MSWIDMLGTYEERNVANFKNDIFEIDTSRVTDRAVPYETAIAHKDFRHGEWIILGWRKTKEEAQRFHDLTVKHFIEHEHELDHIDDAYEGVRYKRERV